MRKLLATACGRSILCLLLTLLSANLLCAQITVTSPVPAAGIAPFSTSAAGAVVFGVKNTNATPITITDIGNYVPSGFTGTFTLWYRTTGVTGAPNAINTTNGWVQAAQKALPTTSTAGITPIFTGLNITITAGATYRFAISGPANSPFFGGAGTTANKYEGGGLEIYVQDNANSPGYGGAFPGPPASTPRSFIGSVTFKPTVACTEPPVPGTAVASASSVCSGSAFNLNVIGGSIGTGQTYQWQWSTDNSTWADLGAPSSSSGYIAAQTATTYYRAAVTCGTSTAYSASVQVINIPKVSGTFTINSGQATGSGNFQTFTEAVNSLLSCGIDGSVVFNVAAGSGPYNEQVTIPAINGASATNTITINGNGATLQATPVSGTQHLIRLDGADYVTINNLKIKAQSGAAFGWGIHLTNGADYNTITNCDIDISTVTNTTQHNSAGIVASGSTTQVTTAGNANNNTISGNTITGAYQGIIIYGATGSLNAVSNTITRNTIKDFMATGITLSNNDGAMVSFNDINRASRTDVLDFIGIQLVAGNKRCTVNANRIHDTHTAAATQNTFAYGIYLNACDAAVGAENKITNNLIYKFNSTSGIVYGLYNNGSDHVQYYHNTIVLDNTNATAGITRGFYQLTLATGIQLKNNIFYITRGGSGAKHCLYFETASSTIVSNKNVLYLNSGTGTNGIGSFGTGNQVTLANWQSVNAGAYDQQSLSADPLFKNADAGDYTPTEASINNLGDNVGVAKDINDQTRSLTTPDAGAIEFDAQLCTGTPTPGTAAATVAEVCNSNIPFTLTVTGASIGSGITYQWQSSTDNVNWSDVSGATNSNYSPSGISANTYFRRAITCSGATAYTASVLVNFIAPDYAALPFSESFEADWLNVCHVKDVPNNSWRNIPFSGNSSWRRYDQGTTAGWSTNGGIYLPAASAGNHSARFHTINAGSGNKGKLDLYLNANTGSGNARKRLMFDYINANGSDSLVVSVSTDNGSTFTRLDSARATASGVWRTKTLYFNSTSATTVLRFEGVAEGTSDMGLDNIQVVDYPDCSGTPAGGTAQSSAASVCTEAFTLSVNGASVADGISYQWQSSIDNTTWTDINGATALTLTTTQPVTTYYRLVVTCSNGGGSAPSVPVIVSRPPGVFGTFTINKAQATGNGNFQSFNDAYDFLKCGIGGKVVFNVEPGSGPYDEQLVMLPIPGASATNTVTFNGNRDSLSYLSTNSNEKAVIKLNGADYITFNNLVITAKGDATVTGQQGFGVQLMNDADYNTISNCTINIDQSNITSLNFAGIVVNSSHTNATTEGPSKCDYNTISGNTINGGHYGITLVSNSTDANGNNKIVNNTIKDFYTYGISAIYTFNTLIEGNTITRPNRTSSGAFPFAGISFSKLSTKANITRNTITNPFGGATNNTSNFHGIMFTNVPALVGFENIVSNNKIYNVNGSGNAYGIYNDGSHVVRYYHNTISIDGSAKSSTAAHITAGFYQTNKADDLVFKNNIITITRGGPSAKTAIYLNTNTTTMVSDHNGFFIATTVGDNNIGYWNTPQATLASWRSATGQDANSVYGNPAYTDEVNGNLKPQNIALDNQGTPVGVASDFEGITRSVTTPDMGAYEFTAPACVTPPVGGTTSVSETPVCPETPVVLMVSGNSVGVGQTYQWQSSTSDTGPFNNFGPAVTKTDTTILASTLTQYFRLATTCGGQTSYSEPVLLTITQPLSAGTYTINKNAPASATNFVSFNAAKAAMSCGVSGPVVFNVESGSGPYTEQLILDSIRGTSDVSTITFNGNGNTIKYSSSNGNERAVIKLNRADYITFDNLVVDATGAGSYGYGVQLINNADYNTISNCTINLDKASTSTTRGGIVMNAAANSATTNGATLCDNNTIIGNTINGGYHGITLVGSAGDYINNNRIINNKVFDFYSYGIYLSGTFNTLVEGNEIARPGRTTTTASTYAIHATDVSEGLTISKNRIHNPFGAMPSSTNSFYGMYFTGVDASADHMNTISNNLIYNVNGQGLVFGIYTNGSDNASFYHNTISLDNTASTATNATHGFYQNTEAEGIELKNNLITISRGGTGNKFALNFNTATTQFTSDYNNIYLASGPTFFFGYLNSNRATLNDWETASGKDLNTGTVDPVYTDPAIGNYKPTSLLIDNRGTGVGITTDINGDARSASAPDVGAYEFAVPACTTPPVAGATTATPSSGVCMGTPVLLSLSGNTFGSGMSFQWEYATSASGPYLPLGAPKAIPDTVIEASGNLYYRAAVTCSGNTEYATPILVSLNSAFLSGVYTIDPAQAASSQNFQSFTTAVAALECGITGPVTFKVAPGTYTEQIYMHKIGGAGSNSRVTFQSASGDASSVILNYTATTPAKNYVLKLDGASYITYKDLTLTSVDSVYGRVIELAGTASYDSLVNLVVNAPANDTTGLSVVGIFANNLKGGSNVIKGNTIIGGSNGIYLRGTSATVLTPLNVIEDNTINGAYHCGIQANYSSRVKVNNNTIRMSTVLNNPSYGLFAGYCDTAYQVMGNKVTISNANGTVQGIRTDYCDGTAQERGKVAGNTVLATTNNTGTLYGLVNNYSTYNNTVNNVVSIYTTAANSYALYAYEDNKNNYYNNSIYSAATSATNNHAAYFYHTNKTVDIRNNIFAHNGGGRALYIYDPNQTFSDYNMLYTSGTVLVQVGTPAASYTNLQAWRNAHTWDKNSIVYMPAFVSDVDLRPNLSDSTVWAMHGRGVQITGNDYDFNNDPRPTTLAAGVPDLGAYEFMPTSVPPVLTAIPAVPVAGTTQTFMFGTDTVSKINWGATVPATISMRRYSGVTPPGLTPATPHMYYYTDVQTTGTSASSFSKKDFFIDPWQGRVNYQYQVRLGRTNAAGTWTVGAGSRVDTIANVISEDALTGLFKFTGLVDINAVPPAPVFTQQIDSSNMGKRFWVAYANSYDFYTNNQDMVLYLSTGSEPATVTVRVNGTSWVKTYSIPANTAITTDKMPKAGFNDSRLLAEGKYKTGISIESDVPIVAYAHIYYEVNSGATMLLPVGTYGYEYYTLNSRQFYSSSYSHSSFFVVADRDNTVVEITPSNPTHGGKPAGVPFRVTLNKGEVYQVLGAYIGGQEGYDLTGSRIVSVSNSDGKCYPIAVFAGSSRTLLACDPSITTGGGDLLFQQVFPSQAWGTRYLTAPTSNAGSASSLQTNIYRVMVKDPATQVKLNGSVLTGLVANRYYQFVSNTADYIEANKPIMVAQYMASSGGSCAGSSTYNDGDPELFYLSPIEQAVRKTRFYRNNKWSINVNYLTMIIPTGGLASLTIDGTRSFDHTYAHPNLPGYTVVIKKWGTSAEQSWVQSDSAFTGIVYGEGAQESYGYNVGTLVKNLNALNSITNTLSTTGGTSEYTCTNAPFKVSVLVPVKPTSLTWNFSNTTGITPNANVTLNNPVVVDSVVINGKKYYKYVLPQDYQFSQVGTYTIPVTYTHPEIEGCSNTLETYLTVQVNQAPMADFTVDFTNCIGDVAKFNGLAGSGVSVAQWNWNFGDGGTATIQNPTRQYATADTFKVQLKLVISDGCVGDTTKKVVVNARPVVDVVKDTLSACNAAGVTFSVKNPAAGVTYNWYNAATGGTAVGSGNSFTANISGPTANYYLEAVSNGCASTSRRKVTALLLPNLASPVVVVDSISVNLIRFKWGAVAGATSYEVSIDGGATWTEPTGALSHTVSGLQPLQTVTLIVRALGGCQIVQSLPVTGKALTNQVFIPNTFSPNGDRLNDVLQVYGYVVKEMQFQVFNQWGEKIHESRDMKRAWDGTHKGKLQPSGVYLYVCKLTLNDGSIITKKGSINLVR